MLLLLDIIYCAFLRIYFPMGFLLFLIVMMSFVRNRGDLGSCAKARFQAQ